MENNMVNNIQVKSPTLCINCKHMIPAKIFNSSYHLRCKASPAMDFVKGKVDYYKYCKMVNTNGNCYLFEAKQ